jgi:cell surface protein SprA
MSFINYQLNESKNKEITVGLGYRIKGIVLPIRIKGKKQKLDNDVNFKFDFSFRDNVIYAHKLDQNIGEPVSGMKQIKISPSIDYVVNNRLNIRLFFDRTRTIPHTSQSYPMTSAQGGITVRFTLGQ